MRFSDTRLVRVSIDFFLLEAAPETLRVHVARPVSLGVQRNVYAVQIDWIGTRSQQCTLNSAEICPIKPNHLCCIPRLRRLRAHRRRIALVLTCPNQYTAYAVGRRNATVGNIRSGGVRRWIAVFKSNIRDRFFGTSTTRRKRQVARPQHCLSLGPKAPRTALAMKRKPQFRRRPYRP